MSHNFEPCHLIPVVVAISEAFATMATTYLSIFFLSVVFRLFLILFVTVMSIMYFVEIVHDDKS